MIGLINTRISNLGSVQRWLKALNLDFKLIEIPDDFVDIDLLIFPGVGSFDTVANYLNISGLGKSIINYINSGKKYVGICLGFQVLFESSEEGKELGLGIFKEKISKLNRDYQLRLPHVGFNDIQTEELSFIMNEFNNKSFYFTHSYGLLGFSPPLETKLGYTKYGKLVFISCVENKNILAFQFHPEKSSALGISLLKRIIEWSKKD